ncbi:hypothetical protein ACQPXS_46350 [Streptomyces sp. CA-142005]|uniref:hypothetical protein n=1 Tax=Streptomyces sp. CA-142005 TaxID=3240052 RepID=UPI003D93A2CC
MPQQTGYRACPKHLRRGVSGAAGRASAERSHGAAAYGRRVVPAEWLAPALQHLLALEAGFLPGSSAREE